MTLKEIRTEAQKPKDQESIMAWYLYRRVSPFVTWVLARTLVTPNMVTWSMFVFGIAGGVLLSMKSSLMAFLGPFCFQLLYLLDCVDGELAKITRTFSPLGEPLDLLCHYVTETALYVGTGIGLYFRTEQNFILYVMLMVTIFQLFHRTSIATLYLLYGAKKNILFKKVRTEGRFKNTFFKIIGFFSRSDSVYSVLILTLGFDLFFPGLLHPWGVTIFYYIGIGVLIVAKTLIRIPRLYRLAKESTDLR